MASATAPNATTAVLTFGKPEYANLFLIASTYVLPEHLWKTATNPAKYYWQKSQVRVPEVIFPANTSNNTANPALARGEIGYAGNNVTDVKSNFLRREPEQPHLGGATLVLRVQQTWWRCG